MMLRKSITIATLAGALSLTMGVAAMAQTRPTNTRPNDNTTSTGNVPGPRAPLGGGAVDQQDRREQRTNDVKQTTTDQGATTAAGRAPPGMPGATTRKDVQQQRTNDIKQQTSDEGTTSGKPSR